MARIWRVNCDDGRHYWRYMAVNTKMLRVTGNRDTFLSALSGLVNQLAWYLWSSMILRVRRIHRRPGGDDAH